MMNEKKIMSAKEDLNNAKIRAEAIKAEINRKIEAGEDYAEAVETLDEANTDYTNAQIKSVYYNLLYGEKSDTEAPIIQLVKHHTWSKTELKPETNKTTKKLSGYKFDKRDVFHELLFFANRYGKNNGNIAGLADVNALDAFNDLYKTIQAVQAVRYGKDIQYDSVRKDVEAYEKAKDKQGLKNPLSTTSIGKVITKAVEAFIGVTPKMNTKIHSEEGDDGSKTLINFTIDSMVQIKTKGTKVDVHFVEKKTFAKYFMYVMHCVLMNTEIDVVYDNDKKSEIDFVEAEVEDVEAPAEDAKTEAPATEDKPADDKPAETVKEDKPAEAPAKDDKADKKNK